MGDTWDTKEVYDYTIDDALEAWREFECGVIADEMLKSFQDELATLRAAAAENAIRDAKAAAWDEVVRLYNLPMPERDFGYAVGRRVDEFLVKDSTNA